MRSQIGPILSWVVFASTFQPVLAETATQPLPAWISKAILEHRSSKSPDVIEEAAYKGKRAFLLTRGDRFDTGDEHVLFGEDGQEICQFGGFVGRVTAGSCDIDEITYVRTLYPAKSQ